MKRQLLGVAAILLSISTYAQDNPLWMRYCAISPDGTTIAFTYKGDIYTVPSTGGRASQITTNPAHDTKPIWSPDGKKIAFASDRMGSMDIFEVNKEGGIPKRLTTHSGNETPVAYKDAGHILFLANIMPTAEDAQFPSGQFQQVYEVNTEGGRPVLFSSMPMEDISINHTGNTLLYHDKKGYEDPWRKHHTSSITRDIWLCSLNGNRTFRKQTAFNGEDRTPVWASDDKSFYYLSEEKGSFNIFKRDIDGNTSKQITNHTKHPVRFLSAASNGTLCYGYDGDGAPNSSGLTGEEQETRPHFVTNVTHPTLTVYHPEKPNGMAIIMCPGGGYRGLGMDGEGYDMAPWFCGQGITYIVLKYRMPNGHWEVPVSDAEQAIRMVRQHAKEWNVNPYKVGLMGASAGGHLTATLATHYNSETRPDFQILLYPVVTMMQVTRGNTRTALLGKNPTMEQIQKFSAELQVTPDTPQAFIALTSDDPSVAPYHGVNYYLALQKNKVPATLHVYPTGGHGWGFKDHFKYKQQWTQELEKWLRDGVVFPENPEPMLRIGKSYLGTKYVANTLDQDGEESLVIRTDAVDCLTFVEYTLAQALGSSFADNLQKIRYRDGIINGYPSRLHYTSEWIENGIRHGFLTDITAKNSAHTQKISLSYMSTHPKQYKKLADSPENVRQMAEYEKAISGKVVHWLPKSELPEAGLPWIMNGDIIAITTKMPGLDIAHVGIAEYKEGKLHLLHASSTLGKVVVSDEPLNHMLNNNKSWTGIRVVRMSHSKNN